MANQGAGTWGGGVESESRQYSSVPLKKYCSFIPQYLPFHRAYITNLPNQTCSDINKFACAFSINLATTKWRDGRGGILQTKAVKVDVK